MEKIMCKVNIVGSGAQSVEVGTTLWALSQTCGHLCSRPILLAVVDNELQDLCRPILHDCTITFLDITDPNGYRAYQRSVSFLMIYAAKSELGIKTRVTIQHSINKNYYCELPDVTLTDELLTRIEGRMHDAVAQALPIDKHSLPLESARRIADAMGLADKAGILRYRRTSFVNFYKLDWFYDYFYGQMVPNTALLSTFKLTRKSGGFMLQFPAPAHDYALAAIPPNPKLTEVFEESSQWTKILRVDMVGTLNDKLCQDQTREIIRVTEALHEKKCASLADQILHQRKSIVLIAGPSSSGKTTFASRLGVQLRVNGLTPHIISLDDYYLNRDQLPRDENGHQDFETVDALDLPQLNHDLTALLDGQTVEVPIFSFLTGRRQPQGRPITLRANDVLILEGIHGLNEAVSRSVPKSEKFKIFISALTQLNLDDHNRIPTTDTRLVRRIVRDHNFRAFSAARTIALWPAVLRGESKYIFPYQEEADAFFNSALIYEMCVLKQFAEPLLFGVANDQSAYTEAKRLIKFLDCFLGVSSELVPPNSILREFIGGSCF